MAMIEFQALRLSAWGLALVLCWLLFYRWRDHITGRVPDADERAIQPMTALLVGIAGSGLAGMTLLAFTAPLFGGYVAWLNPMHGANAMLAVVLLIALLVLMIDRLAYHRTTKWLWAGAWLIFVHFSIWGSAWLAA